MQGTPAQARVGGISSLSHSSEHANGIRVLGSVHVGPPVVLMERIDPFPEGEAVVPIAYSFLFLHGSEWRTTSDGLYFRPPMDREPLGFKVRVRGEASAAEEGVRTELDVSIRPRDGSSWTEVQTKHDIVVQVN